MATGNSVIPNMSGKSIKLPMDIDLHDHVLTVSFHPFKDILAAGRVDGPIKIWSYTTENDLSNHELMSFDSSQESCRIVHFSSSGDTLFTGSSDKVINLIDMNEGTVTKKLVQSDGSAIYSMLPIDDFLLATGDDDGNIVVWDFRRELPIMTEKVCLDYVSDLKVGADKRTLLASSGGGSFSVLNLRSRIVTYQSELFNDELLAIAVLKNQSHVVVGDSGGGLNILKWGEWSMSDKFITHPKSLSSLVAFNDDIVCIGNEGGEIQAIEINPNRLLGVLSSHDNLAIEVLGISHCKNFIGSASYDGKIKFHDLSRLKNVGVKKAPKFSKLAFFSDMA